MHASIDAIPSAYRNKKIACLYALLGGNACVFFNASFDELKPICATEHSRHRVMLARYITIFIYFLIR